LRRQQTTALQLPSVCLAELDAPRPENNSKHERTKTRTNENTNIQQRGRGKQTGAFL
jgi:hypothetical protein